MAIDLDHYRELAAGARAYAEQWLAGETGDLMESLAGGIEELVAERQAVADRAGALAETFRESRERIAALQMEMGYGQAAG